jgi:hypothetical protein
LSCVVAGTTSAGEIVLPSPVVENASVVDGKATWQIRKIGSGGGEAVGVIKAFAGNGDIPSGYLLCDGSAVSRTMFPDLFAAIGTTYGAGDGSTTFNVPDYNTAQRFAQGDTVAGTVKQAGLPNITGEWYMNRTSGASVTGAVYYNGGMGALSSYNTALEGLKMGFDASLSNPIYGASDTVQPNALTTRFIIKAFDGQTADSALIDITQYAQELAGKANITGSNLVYHRDVITTSGTYTAPATALYKITVKGGGGGGEAATVDGSYYRGGRGGGEGGTTIAYERMTTGQTASVVIGAGGVANSGAGGDSSVTVGSNTYTGGGGTGGGISSGGSGTIPGSPGGTSRYAQAVSPSTQSITGGEGGGNGGGTSYGTADGVNGGGGAGGAYTYAGAQTGGAGGDGYVWFEYTSSV